MINSDKYYKLSDLMKLSGLKAQEIRYLIKKNKIQHKTIRTRKYFTNNDLNKIMHEAAILYPQTKKQKAFFDYEYRIENLSNRFKKLKQDIQKIIKV